MSNTESLSEIQRAILDELRDGALTRIWNEYEQKCQYAEGGKKS